MSPAAAVASGLVAAALLAVGGGPVALTGTPAVCGVLAGGATVTCLGPSGQEPALTSLEQAPAAGGARDARRAQSGRLTRGQRPGRLKVAHGRYCSRAVRRREGGTSRRHFAPDAWGRPPSTIARHTSASVTGIAQRTLRKWLSSWPLLTSSPLRYRRSPYVPRLDAPRTTPGAPDFSPLSAKSSQPEFGAGNSGNSPLPSAHSW